MFFLIRCVIFVSSRCKVFLCVCFKFYAVIWIIIRDLSLYSYLFLVFSLIETSRHQRQKVSHLSRVSVLVFPSSQSTKNSDPFFVVYPIKTFSVGSTPTIHNSFFHHMLILHTHSIIVFLGEQI